MSEKPVLIVEDEAEIAGLLRDYLRAEGFSVSWLARGDAVPDWLSRHPAALILLDLALPGLSGMEICKQVRQSSNLPIIMLSARVEEIDRLLGLELGADDYICKPFSPREVVARVKTVLRRSGGITLSATQGLRFDEAGWRAEINGRDLGLTAIEFQLLRLLASAPERLFTRNQLISGMYQDGREVSERTIDSHIRKIRRKIEAIAPDLPLIEAMYGAGYRFVGKAIRH
jgi:two-component system response regulator BaeR